MFNIGIYNLLGLFQYRVHVLWDWNLREELILKHCKLHHQYQLPIYFQR